MSAEDPVRVYDAFVDALAWESLGIDCDAKKVGCPQFDRIRSKTLNHVPAVKYDGRTTIEYRQILKG